MTGIERLRKLSKDMLRLSLWVRLTTGTEKDWDCCQGDGRTVNDELLSIADQIEREHNISDREEHDAAAWVREHGGLDAVEARLMPESIEWPRYEDGEPVGFGDEASRLGEDFGVSVIFLYCDGSYALNFRSYSKGERVKRPAVPAADGEPLEVGQTVWAIDDAGKDFGEARVVDSLTSDGEFTVRGVLSCITFDPKRYSHQRPVLDAEGNRIEPAMDVWWVCEGDDRGTHAEKLHVESIGKDGLVTCDPFNGGTWVELEPSELYVHKPVLDADGVPIKKGDTVWDMDAEADTPLTVVEVSSDLIRCEYTWKDGKTYRPCYPPSVLTHTKPEPPDSWERVEEDARGLDSGVDRGLLTHTHEDIVRRCKALAGDA